MKRYKNIQKKGAISLINFEITFDALHVYKRPAELEQHSYKTWGMLQSNPQQCIRELPAWIEKYPTDPIIAGYLVSAYQFAKEYDKAEQLIIENYKKFPNYLFARCAYINLCIQEGRLKEATSTFDKKFVIKLMYPERSVFHVTEVIYFSMTCTRYFAALGDIDQVGVHMDMIKKLDPEHPFLTEEAQGLLYKAKFIKRFPKMQNLL